MSTLLSTDQVKVLIDRIFSRLNSDPDEVISEILALPGINTLGITPRDVIAAVIDHVKNTFQNQNDTARLQIEGWLFRQDRAVKEWALGSPPISYERRNRICKLLNLSPDETEILNANFPPFVTIAVGHSDDFESWYTEERKAQCAYYSSSLKSYLKEKRGWSERNLFKLDQETDQIIAGIADPLWAAPEANPPRIYGSRGLVVGYVQSGKTTAMNLTIAKAVDCGYKLVIVLAGLTDLLRTQTQRRLDMEVVGQSILEQDPEARERPDGVNAGGYMYAKDWDDFIRHPAPNPGQTPRQIERLTTRQHDFSTWQGGQAFPPDFLTNSNVCKIIVIKKNVTRLKKLVNQLKAIAPEHQNRLSVLILDDESDQAAAVNLVKPDSNGEQQVRGVNEQVVHILKLMKNVQYVGFTATPAANCFISPENEWDMYPKDFILPLDRPDGYMGILDFHDIDEAELEPLPPYLPQVKKKQHVRDIFSPKGQDDRELRSCLDTFVLTGAIKLYRASRNPKYKAAKHHTLFYSDSVRIKDMESSASRILTMWAESGFESIAGLTRLRSLYESDILENSSYRGDLDSFPASFDDLLPFISASVQKIDENFDGHHVVITVNGSEVGTNPDFQERSIWKVVIGGMKLSRGYTIEGLTVTYFRRKSLVQAPLMQMGRWFGYRGGYQDLVRLYISRSEPAKPQPIDVYDVFEKTCIDEERLRRNFRKWFQTEDSDGKRLQPKHLRPLVMVSDTKLLPAPKNQMWNVELVSMTFNEFFPTRFTVKPEELRHNEDVWLNLLKSHPPTSSPQKFYGNKLAYFSSPIPHDLMTQAISSIRHSKDHPNQPWENRLRFKKFLASEECLIKDWIIVLPQLQGTPTWIVPGLPSFTRAERSWKSRQAEEIQAPGEPKDRQAAKALTGNESTDHPNRVQFKDLSSFAQGLSTGSRGVVLLVPITVKGENNATPVMGFECILSRHPDRIGFRVKTKQHD